MKSLSILGATGSIGTNALEIVRKFPDRFKVTALAAKTRVAALAKLIVEFSPRIAAVADADHADRLRALLPPDLDVTIVHGQSGYVQTATWETADMVLGAMVGAAGLVPSWRPSTPARISLWPTRKRWSWPGPSSWSGSGNAA